MCRMILARGDFSVQQVMEAARAMCCGETARHDGPITKHPNGWGCLWLDNGKVRTLHGTETFADALPGIDTASIRTHFLAIHVRHATLSKNRGVQFSHPLFRLCNSTPWYLMHNGFLPTVYPHLGLHASHFDSEEYLEYIVGRITPEDLTRPYLVGKMTKLAPGGSSGNAFFITDDKAWAWQWHAEDTPFPHYFTMHMYRHGDTQYIASEQILALGEACHWRQMQNHELHEISLRE
ncbi:class II glutamine amidotransferase [Serratia proteamaculans]|uniref:class II glutamine amidotransferase n=1 Tax=Serratia proteamaculans TaxID=28151 RepID=UPI0039AFB7B7